MAWNPTVYEQFKNARAKPFHDLVAMVRPKPGMRVVDLGCGTGELTKVLHERLGAKETLGIDSSAEMLAKAKAGDGVSFEQGDIAAFARGGWDLIFSNAALQWVPDEERVLERLCGLLAPGGQIAVQVPANEDHVSHTTAAEVASEEPFRGALGGHVRTSSILAPERYAAVLHRLGLDDQEVLLRVYPQLLPVREDVVEWVRGTLLTDYESRLPAALWPRFLEAYQARLLPRLADERPFFYPYKRILFRGSR
jgi:trans-aconitate 2-methyltransferase